MGIIGLNTFLLDSRESCVSQTCPISHLTATISNMSHELHTGKTEASYYHGRPASPAGSYSGSCLGEGRVRGDEGSYPVDRRRCDADDDEEDDDLVAEEW